MAKREKPVVREFAFTVPERPYPKRRARPVRHKAGRHRRRCVVCAHPKRDDIERDFLRWRSPEKLACDYDIADHSSIYRHVHATGLYARRQQTIVAALESVMERSDKRHSSDLDVVRAAAAYAHMDESGQWTDPPIQFLLKVIEGSEISQDLLRAQATRPKQPKSNSQFKELKNGATR